MTDVLTTPWAPGFLPAPPGELLQGLLAINPAHTWETGGTHGESELPKGSV